MAPVSCQASGVPPSVRSPKNCYIARSVGGSESHGHRFSGLTNRKSPPLPMSIFFLASPRILTEPLYGPEPGPELLLRLYFEFLGSLLQ